MSDPSNHWTGGAVRLRAVETEDWEHFHHFSQDTEMERSGYQISFPQSRAAVQRWSEEQAVARPPNDNARFAIATLGGVLVGSLNVVDADPRHGTFGYGIALGREHRRKGYATDAIRILLRHYFGELRYQKANARVYAFNEASVGLHQKLGFREEGRLRRMYYSAGEYHDVIWFGMTAEEFGVMGER